MKIALYCDSLVGKGGQVRAQIDLANHLNADIITCGYDRKIKKWLPIKTKIIDIGNFTYKYNKALSFYFEIPLRFLFCKDYGYDINIYSGAFSFFAAKKKNKNIWLSYTPNRILYDLKDWKLKQSSPVQKVFFRIHILMFSYYDRRKAASSFRNIVAISETVKKRIRKYYKLDSLVINPPISLKKFNYEKNGDYYLAISRLTPEKRMDVIVKAFSKMPEKKLVLVGDGIMKKKIIQLIKESNNIILKQNISEKDLIKLYANCFAVIYIPKDEDYGYVPLEAMASGKICIAANEGGCRETVINGKTGYLITPNDKSIISVVRSLDTEKVKKMRASCEIQAANYSTKKSFKIWDNLIYQTGL